MCGEVGSDITPCTIHRHLALQNIASFGHNVVYGNVIQNSPYEEGKHWQ